MAVPCMKKPGKKRVFTTPFAMQKCWQSVRKGYDIEMPVKSYDFMKKGIRKYICDQVVVVKNQDWYVSCSAVDYHYAPDSTPEAVPKASLGIGSMVRVLAVR